MANRSWKMLANNQIRPVELHLQNTALLIFEVEVRSRLIGGPFPSTIKLVRLEGEQETVVAETTITAPVS